MGQENQQVVISKFTSFIDMVNFFPVQVNKIHTKNESGELYCVMNSKANVEELDRSKQPDKNETGKISTEARLYDLLRLTSEKIYERFKTFQQAFRYMDTDHSQALSVNEFA